jgi:RNA polymerase sigma-70 factor (ECF subfamily)
MMLETARGAVALSDEELIVRVRAGENTSCGMLLSRHHKRLHSVARRILRNDAEAEDAVQEAYLRLLTHLDQFSGRSSFLTYVARIVINESLSRIRSQARFPTTDIGSVPGSGHATAFVCRARNPEQQTINRELNSLLETALQRLPEKYRVVFRMREIDEISVAEAAAFLGLTAECVKTRLHRAKALLRGAFEKYRGSIRPRPQTPQPSASASVS